MGQVDSYIRPAPSVLTMDVVTIWLGGLPCRRVSNELDQIWGFSWSLASNNLLSVLIFLTTDKFPQFPAGLMARCSLLTCNDLDPVWVALLDDFDCPS
jgi:hypothetical protein